MKIIGVIGMTFVIAVFGGCGPTVKEYAYYPSQFRSRGEWLQFCDHYWTGNPRMCRDE